MSESENEELRFSVHFYGYLITLAIAGFGLFLVSFEGNILRQFRSWISPQTLNSYMLTWFAVSVISSIVSFFYGVVIQLFGKNRLLYVFWYLIILLVTLFFATIFFDIWRTHSNQNIAIKLLILVLSNIVTIIFSAIFYYLNFERRYNFWVFTLGIIAATTAYNWLYLSIIDKISI